MMEDFYLVVLQQDSGDGKIYSWLVKTDSMGMTKAAFTLGIKENTLVIKKIKSTTLSKSCY